MGGILSNIHDQEEGYPWDVRWSQLEQDLAAMVRLAPSELSQPAYRRSATTGGMGESQHGEKEHEWDVRWSNLERARTLELNREALAAAMQQQLLQKRPTVVVQDTCKAKVVKATKTNEPMDSAGEGAAPLAAARAAGA